MAVFHEGTVCGHTMGWDGMSCGGADAVGFYQMIWEGVGRDRKGLDGVGRDGNGIGMDGEGGM